MEKNECQNEIRMFIHEVPGVQGISCAGVNIQLSPVKVFQKIYHIKTSNTHQHCTHSDSVKVKVVNLS